MSSPCRIHSEQARKPRTPGVPQGPEPGLIGRWVWELVFFHSVQPLAALLFPSEEERILASQLAEGW